MMNNSKIFKVRQSGYLFETECCLLGKEVLDNVFVRDLLGMNVIPFEDKGRHYQRQHQLQFNGDVVVIRVGVAEGCGIVGATIYFDYSRRLREPYVAIEDHSDVFESIDAVKDMVERAFKWIYKDTEATVYLEPSDEKIYWYKECCEAHEHAKLTENIVYDKDWDVNIYLKNVIKNHKKKKGASPPKKNTKEEKKCLRDLIADQSKADEIMQKISDDMKGKTAPYEVMMPTTATIAAEIMDPPSLGQFKTSFPDVEISSTSFYRLRDPDCKVYRHRLKKNFKNKVKEMKAI